MIFQKYTLHLFGYNNNRLEALTDSKWLNSNKVTAGNNCNVPFMFNK